MGTVGIRRGLRYKNMATKDDHINFMILGLPTGPLDPLLVKQAVNVGCIVSYELICRFLGVAYPVRYKMMLTAKRAKVVCALLGIYALLLSSLVHAFMR